MSARPESSGVHPGLGAGALAVLVAVAGCVGARPSVDPPAPDVPRLEVGTGTARFVELADGDELPMVKGAQGGWHVWVSARATGMDVELAELTVEHQPADESEPPIVSASGAAFDPADEAGRRVSLGWAAIFSDPSCSVGRLHRIRLTVTTASGDRLSAEREIVPTAGDFPPPPCAASE